MLEMVVFEAEFYCLVETGLEVRAEGFVHFDSFGIKRLSLHLLLAILPLIQFYQILELIRLIRALLRKLLLNLLIVKETT